MQSPPASRLGPLTRFCGLMRCASKHRRETWKVFDRRDATAAPVTAEPWSSFSDPPPSCDRMVSSCRS